MYFIKKKLIKLYKNKKKITIYTKAKSSIITKEVLGKCFFIYNGKTWIKKPIDNNYLLHKPIGALKNVNSKVISVYKNKKKKQNKNIRKKTKKKKK